MTTPGGSSPFQQGDDFVTLRLSMDIPGDAVTGIRTLVQEVNLLRTSTEAASRSQDSFVKMLEAQAGAADRAAAAIRNLSAAQTTGQPQLNAPPQYVSPFAGTTAGMGMGRTPASAPEAQEMLNELRETNPRAYINKMAASGWVRSGDVTTPTEEGLTAATQRISNREQALRGQLGGRGIAEQVLSEYGGAEGETARRAVSGMSPATQQAVGPAEQATRRAAGRVPGGAEGGGGGLIDALGFGGGLGGVMKALGPIGTGLGAAALGYGLFQRTGEAIQGARAMGSIRGGGVGEGLGYETSIRAMAANPFITNEQARQIVQQGLREGYTGREFDTITGFVAQNLKDMNMDISSSFELLRKNVNEGGQSLNGLNTNLRDLQELSKAGATSLPDLIKGFAATSAAGINAGMPGAQAAQMAMAAANVNNVQGLQGTGQQLVQSMLQPQNLPFLQYQGGLQVPPGVLPGALPFMVGGTDMVQASSNVIKGWATQYWTQAGRPAEGTAAYYNALVLWQMRLRAQGVPWANDAAQVKAYFHQYTIEGTDPFTQGIQDTQKQQQKLEYRAPTSRVSAAQRDSGPTVWDELKKIPGLLGLGSSQDEQVGYHNAALDQVLAAYDDKGGITVLDESGKPIKFDRKNRDQVEKLINNQYTWRPATQKDGRGYTLAEGPTAPSSAAGGTTNVSGQVTIGLTPEARKLLSTPQTIQLTPHEQAANAGATDGNGNVMAPNNPPPGYGGPRR